MRQDSERGPTKIGLSHRKGWVAYLNKGLLFVKYIDYDDSKPYPDRGCNFETFTNEDMLEMESLGPLAHFPMKRGTYPAEHTERWELHRDVPPVKNEADVDRHVLPRIAQ